MTGARSNRHEGIDGRQGALDIPVWDPLVRVTHWVVVLCVIVASFADGEENLHAWVGYVALGFVVFRLIWGVAGPANARFTAFPPSASRAIVHARGMFENHRKVYLSHNPLGALMVYNLWATLLVMGTTGHMMTTITFFGVDWVEEVHELTYDWLLLSVFLHIGGVVFDTVFTRISLVRAMITGKKRVPAGTDVE